MPGTCIDRELQMMNLDELFIVNDSVIIKKILILISDLYNGQRSHVNMSIDIISDCRQR